ncbi:CRISPR-associated endoribonuclease Cas6 [Clostridium cadaveris]|uniref:CRISPR-associated endoribonuclease Cas6 n=1 Tax=Clostridium cadaveris TaxID=1529 RepID=UPI0015B5C340|nr:CRISPR-associated endoribonuclease Cas6 [Clostridium cadaveris]NWK11573.1 CRISPR-associated endoribonuclease Cas6 [Clostridium cadaveris]
MKVYEIEVKCFLLKDIKISEASSKICVFIDGELAKDPELLELHNKNTYKNYCFNSFYPLEQNKIYKQDKIYTFQIRTVDKKLANVFLNNLKNRYTDEIKGLTTSIRIIPQKPIEKLYSISPAIMKTENGYWKNNISLSEFERHLNENLIKKYNLIMDTKIDEKFQLYTTLEFMNKKPVTLEYKGIKLLGDKICMQIDSNKTAQDIAYMAIGTGVLEVNARGAGYVNYRWL